MFVILLNLANKHGIPPSFYCSVFLWHKKKQKHEVMFLLFLYPNKLHACCSTKFGLKSITKASLFCSYLFKTQRKYVNTNNRVADDNPDLPFAESILEHNSWIVNFSREQISANDNQVSRSKRILVLRPFTITFLQTNMFYPFLLVKNTLYLWVLKEHFATYDCIFFLKTTKN